MKATRRFLGGPQLSCDARWTLFAFESLSLRIVKLERSLSGIEFASSEYSLGGRDLGTLTEPSIPFSRNRSRNSG